jgi:hypothetical protein
MSGEALALKSPIEEDQRYYDLTTQFAELVDGSIRTSFELELIGDDLIAEDGSSLDETTAKGLKEAETIILTKPNLWFEPRRRYIEREEYFEVLQMAKGERPNTKIVVSDFPMELMDQPKDVGGYNVRRKQTMVRVYTRAQGSIRMYTQSLDGSNRQALESVYNHFEQQPQESELLGQRIDRDLSSEDQEQIVDEIVRVYDDSLTEQFGGEWHAGRLLRDFRNTYEFVCRQHDLLGECLRLTSLGKLDRDTAYNMAATFNKRFEQEAQGIIFIGPRVQSDPALIHREIERDGSEARALGKNFSFCGVTLGPESDYQSAGLGNKTDSETKYSFNKKTYCVICQPKPKSGEPKKMCGPCNICRDCDKKLRVKG